jgi:hypothetical protein
LTQNFRTATTSDLENIGGYFASYEFENAPVKKYHNVDEYRADLAKGDGAYNIKINDAIVVLGATISDNSIFFFALNKRLEKKSFVDLGGQTGCSINRANQGEFLPTDQDIERSAQQKQVMAEGLSKFDLLMPDMDRYKSKTAVASAGRKFKVRSLSHMLLTSKDFKDQKQKEGVRKEMKRARRKKKLRTVVNLNKFFSFGQGGVNKLASKNIAVRKISQENSNPGDIETTRSANPDVVQTPSTKKKVDWNQ